MNDSHTHGHHDTSHDDSGHDDHGGNAKYLAVFAGLIVLTAISFFLGNSSLKETAPHVAWAGMMAVSCAKALLVMLFFMHLIWEANWKYVLTIPASLMSVFLVMMLVPDVGNRTKKYSLDRLIHASEPVVLHHDEHEESGGHEEASSHDQPSQSAAAEH